MDDMVFQLKFTTKQLERLAKKAEKEQAKEHAKVKKALVQKNPETARIYAENAIRKKNESLNYLRFAARVDAARDRVQSALTMKKVVKDMGGVTKALDKAMASMDLKKVDQVMSKFEKQFEDLDVRSSTIEQSMGQALTLSAPDDQVSALIQEVADENGLEVTEQLAGLQPGQSVPAAASASADPKQQELDRRLAQLRS